MKDRNAFVRGWGLVLVSAVLIGSLAACGASTDTGGPPPSGDPVSSDSPEENVSGSILYSTQGVSFKIPADWTQAEGTDLFYTADQQMVYGLNGVSALGPYTPREFFASLVEHYESSGQFDSLNAPDELYSWTFGDDVECQVADLVGYQGTVLYCTKLIIAPQKNLVLTFCGQAYRDDPLVIQYALNLLCEDLTFDIGTRDEISGNTFLCEDVSQLCLRSDSGYRY